MSFNRSISFFIRALLRWMVSDVSFEGTRFGFARVSTPFSLGDANADVFRGTVPLFFCALLTTSSFSSSCSDSDSVSVSVSLGGNCPGKAATSFPGTGRLRFSVSSSSSSSSSLLLLLVGMRPMLGCCLGYLGGWFRLVACFPSSSSSFSSLWLDRFRIVFGSSPSLSTSHVVVFASHPW